MFLLDSIRARARTRRIAHTRLRVERCRAHAEARLAVRARARFNEETLRALYELADDDGPFLELEAEELANACSHGCCHEEEERRARRPDPPPGTPEALLSALYQISRAELPDTVAYQPPSVIAHTWQTIAEVLDACGLLDHVGHAAAERACWQAVAYSAGPHRVGRN